MQRLPLVVAGALFAPGHFAAHASDHLDTPSVIADPAADIADVFAWTSSDGRRLNLAMTIVADRFSDRLQYVFHVDSGARFGETTATVPIVCRFDAANAAECWAGDADSVRGDASRSAGLEGVKRRFRVFAGLRDDPFFNNVKGTRAALEKAAAALKGGALADPAGCPRFDKATSQAILDLWRHTDGGPGTNFLVGWKSASLVISIDLDVVAAGGRLLAAWGAIHRPNGTQADIRVRPALGAQIERAGRPLTGNALIGPLAPEEVSDRRKEEYNRAAPADWPQFAADIQPTLALYDGFDGTCGNQWLAKAPARYRALAKLLADDRLWIDSRSTVCRQYLAVERGESNDCGGRTPKYDAIDAFRSLLVLGATTGVDDGVERDDQVHSTTEFPFLAAP